MTDGGLIPERGSLRARALATAAGLLATLLVLTVSVEVAMWYPVGELEVGRPFLAAAAAMILTAMIFHGVDWLKSRRSLNDDEP